MVNLSLVTLACQAFSKPPFYSNSAPSYLPFYCLAYYSQNFPKQTKPIPFIYMCGTVQVYIAIIVRERSTFENHY